MSQQKLFGVIIAASLLFAAWILAQQQPPAAKLESSEVGHFAITAGSDSTVLVDTTSGKTWTLARGVDNERVWIPTERIDSHEDAVKWNDEQRIRQDLIEREREKEKQIQLKVQ